MTARKRDFPPLTLSDEVFRPRPGWGGQLSAWFGRNRSRLFRELLWALVVGSLLYRLPL